jgi:hypothetical protein
MAVSTLRQHDKLNRLARRQHWLGPFLKFIDSIRIDSKEVPAEDERGSKLHLWTTQRLFLEQLAEGLDRGQHTFLTLKGRQQGLSTITLAVLLFWVAVHPRSIAALVCNEEKVRDAFRDLLKRYHESFPPDFFGEAFAKVRHNSSHFLFTNGSRIDYLIAGTRKKNWGESRGYSACLCTEVAAYGEEDGINNFIEALAQENPDRLFMFESTAKGPNHWQEMWNDAERDEENTCRIFLGWWAKDLNRIRKNQPHYQKYAGALSGEETELCNEVLERYGHVVTMEQLAWWRYKLATSDRQSAEQNQPWTPEQAFVLSGYSFFATRLLQEQYERVYHKPFKAYRIYIGTSFWTMRVEQVEASSDAELKIWEDPVREAQYVIGCDPAYGHSDDSDSHCVSIWRCYADRLVQVAEYTDNRPETKHCAWVLCGLAGAYRNSIINLELYGPGRTVMNEIDNVRIQLQADMYKAARDDKEWDEDFMAGVRWFQFRRNDNPGSAGFIYNFETSSKSKMMLFNGFRDAFTSNMLDINSARCIEEMNNMVQEKGDIAPAAPGRQHDDRPFAAALAHFAWDSVACGALRGSMIAAGMTFERVSAAERGENVGGQAIVDKLVYSYFARAEAEAEEREAAGPWAHEDNPDPFLLSAAGWRARRGLA